MNITSTIFDKLYGTSILPHLEYSFQARRLWLRKDINLLEDVQRRSTKLVNGLQDIEYEERVQLLIVDLLSCRMDKGHDIGLRNPPWLRGGRSFSGLLPDG